MKLLKDCAMKLLEKLLEWLASLEHATRLPPNVKGVNFCHTTCRGLIEHLH